MYKREQAKRRTRDRGQLTKIELAAAAIVIGKPPSKKKNSPTPRQKKNSPGQGAAQNKNPKKNNNTPYEGVSIKGMTIQSMQKIDEKLENYKLPYDMQKSMTLLSTRLKQLEKGELENEVIGTDDSNLVSIIEKALREGLGDTSSLTKLKDTHVTRDAGEAKLNLPKWTLELKEHLSSVIPTSHLRVITILVSRICAFRTDSMKVVNAKEDEEFLALLTDIFKHMACEWQDMTKEQKIKQSDQYINIKVDDYNKKAMKRRQTNKTNTNYKKVVAEFNNSIGFKPDEGNEHYTEEMIHQINFGRALTFSIYVMSGTKALVFLKLQLARVCFEFNRDYPRYNVLLEKPKNPKYYSLLGGFSIFGKKERELALKLPPLSKTQRDEEVLIRLLTRFFMANVLEGESLHYVLYCNWNVRADVDLKNEPVTADKIELWMKAMRIGACGGADLYMKSLKSSPQMMRFCLNSPHEATPEMLDAKDKMTTGLQWYEHFNPDTEQTQPEESLFLMTDIHNTARNSNLNCFSEAKVFNSMNFIMSIRAVKSSEMNCLSKIRTENKPHSELLRVKKEFLLKMMASILTKGDENDAKEEAKEELLFRIYCIHHIQNQQENKVKKEFEWMAEICKGFKYLKNIIPTNTNEETYEELNGPNIKNLVKLCELCNQKLPEKYLEDICKELKEKNFAKETCEDIIKEISAHAILKKEQYACFSSTMKCSLSDFLKHDKIYKDKDADKMVLLDEIKDIYLQEDDDVKRDDLEEALTFLTDQKQTLMFDIFKSLLLERKGFFDSGMEHSSQKFWNSIMGKSGLNDGQKKKLLNLALMAIGGGEPAKRASVLHISFIHYLRENPKTSKNTRMKNVMKDIMNDMKTGVFPNDINTTHIENLIEKNKNVFDLKEFCRELKEKNFAKETCEEIIKIIKDQETKDQETKETKDQETKDQETKETKDQETKDQEPKEAKETKAPKIIQSLPKSQKTYFLLYEEEVQTNIIKAVTTDGSNIDLSLVVAAMTALKIPQNSKDFPLALKVAMEMKSHETENVQKLFLEYLISMDNNETRQAFLEVIPIRKSEQLRNFLLVHKSLLKQNINVDFLLKTFLMQKNQRRND